MLKYALFLLAAMLTASTAQAQQPPMIAVTLLAGDRAVVGSNMVAARDVVSRLASRQSTRGGPQLVTVQSCQKVPADSVQNLMRDLQKHRFVVMLDLNPPDLRLCAR